MDQEKLAKRVEQLSKRFLELGYDIGEEIEELVSQKEEIATYLLENKVKKIKLFEDKETNEIGFSMDDKEVSFFLEYGEDEDGEYFDIERIEILK